MIPGHHPRVGGIDRAHALPLIGAVLGVHRIDAVPEVQSIDALEVRDQVNTILQSQ